MTIRLDGARKAIGKLMSDACTITHDTSGTTNATFDPNTLRITNEAAAAVYQGPCLVAPDTESQQAQGGAVVSYDTYRVLLPYDATVPTVGDSFVVDESFDESLIGVPMQVTGVVQSTLVAARSIQVSRVAAAERNVGSPNAVG